jgi:hypothetical protein
VASVASVAKNLTFKGTGQFHLGQFQARFNPGEIEKWLTIIYNLIQEETK